MTDPLFQPFTSTWGEAEAMFYADMANSVPELWTATPEVKRVQRLYHRAFFDREVSTIQRNQARDELRKDLEEVFNVDFDNIFDWESWREGYDAGVFE